MLGDCIEIESQCQFYSLRFTDFSRARFVVDSPLGRGSREPRSRKKAIVCSRSRARQHEYRQ